MSSPEKIPRTSEYPVWLAVPHEARDVLRETAGRLDNGQQAVGWDKEASLWFARPGCDLERVTDWLPDSSRRAGGGDAESEFLDALTQAGLVVQGLPVMDGARHRVSTVEDKNGKKSGVYRGFLDRRPGGWFINYHRAETVKDVTNWSATGGESDPVNRLHIRAAARQAQDDAARVRAETYARQTLAAHRLYDRLPAADPAHSYLVRKGITPTPDLRQTRNGALVVPFFNASGAFKTLQYIPPGGEKYLFKDAPKQGHFLVVGGPLTAGDPVLYAEGYATARSLNLGTGHPVVMTIDAGNMVAVAKVLHEQYPQSQHLFLADFDHAKAENKGLLMATAAAEAVGGQVLYPAFNDDEKARGLTDFNDLHLSRGLDELRTQVAPQLVTATQDMTMSTDQTPTSEPKSAAVKDIEKPQPAALPEALPVENRQSALAPVAEAPPAVGTADMPVQQAASVIEPEKPEPAALPEAIPVQGQQPASAPVMKSEPFLPEDLQKSLLRQPAITGEQPAEAAAVDAIWIGAPRPRGTEEEPQASNIDKDALLARLSWEKHGESAVLYKLDGEPAFVDHGNRLEMAKGAGQSDEKVVAALLTAAQYYRGRIELTGSDEFKAKAIDLIAQHQINVEMKNPVQQAALDDARKALNLARVVPDAVMGNTPAPFENRPRQPEVQASQAAQPQATQPQTVAPELGNQPAPLTMQPQYQPLEAADLTQGAPKPVAPELVNQSAPLMAQPQYQPLEATDLIQGVPKPTGQPITAAVQIEQQPAAPVPSVEPAQQAQASPKISPDIHQPFQAAKDGVTGKILASGQAPFRFEDKNAESTYIKLRTKTGVQTFWGKELAGLLRDTRVQPGKMVTLQWLGKEPVTIKVPRKDEQGVTLGFEDKQAHRNQWALTVMGNPTVRTGQDEGVKLGAYDAVRFAVVQDALIAKLGIEVPMPSRPKDGLYWMTPNGEGSAKAGDELTAPRPPIDPKNTAGEPVISSWTQQGNLDMYLVRGDGPYLQGIARQENEYRHVLVSLPGSNDAPPMVFNAVTPEGLQPIGTGNGINRSGGQPVARENIAFKLEGDSAVRIGKLDAPASVPPDLHVRLGFDERWKEENVLPKSAPTAAPSARPSDPRPA